MLFEASKGHDQKNGQYMRSSKRSLAEMAQGAPELTTTLEDSAQEPESEKEGLTCSGKLTCRCPHCMVLTILFKKPLDEFIKFADEHPDEESFDKWLEKEAKRLKENEERVREVAENIQLSIVAQASVLRVQGPFEAGMYALQRGLRGL